MFAFYKYFSLPSHGTYFLGKKRVIFAYFTFFYEKETFLSFYDKIRSFKSTVFFINIYKQSAGFIRSK